MRVAGARNDEHQRVAGKGKYVGGDGHYGCRAREGAGSLASTMKPLAGMPPIPVAISAHHVHLTQATIERLFGDHHVLSPLRPLSQPGQFAARETVTLAGPRGRIDEVRVLGPPREADQVEISRSDARILGVDPPLRLSGNLAETPGLTLVGPRGQMPLHCGVVCALRHIHMSPEDAKRFGVSDRDVVEVEIANPIRPTIFGEVIVRVSPRYSLELHLDTDEGNAAGVERGTVAYLTRAHLGEHSG